MSLASLHLYLPMWIHSQRLGSSVCIQLALVPSRRLLMHHAAANFSQTSRIGPRLDGDEADGAVNAKGLHILHFFETEPECSYMSFSMVFYALPRCRGKQFEVC